LEPDYCLRFVEEALDAPSGTLKGDESLANLENWDSLAFLTFVAGAQTRFGLTLNPSEVQKCESVGDLCALVEPQLSDETDERPGSKPGRDL
jgi:acyl carrier protein